MNYHRLHLLLVVLTTLLQFATCFTARPLFSLPPLPIMTRFAADSTSDNAESEDLSSSSVPQSNNETSVSLPGPQQQQQQQQLSPIPQQPRKGGNRKKQLDPLLVSLTRMDTTSTSPTKTVPLLGEIEMDGSLLVLIPAVVIAVVGFVMSLIIAFTSRDAIVDSLTQQGDNAAAAAASLANNIDTLSTPPFNTCRGICSSQETDLQSLKLVMDNIFKK